MVEGGAKIISSFLRSGLVNSLVITVAPKFIGDGVEYNVRHEDVSENYCWRAVTHNIQMSKLVHVGSKLIGDDLVTVFKSNAI